MILRLLTFGRYDKIKQSPFANLGFFVGLVCALVSLVLFSVMESIRMSLILDDFLSFRNVLFEFSLYLPMILIYGGLFSFLPAGIGGLILALILDHQAKKKVRLPQIGPQQPVFFWRGQQSLLPVGLV